MVSPITLSPPAKLARRYPAPTWAPVRTTWLRSASARKRKRARAPQEHRVVASGARRERRVGDAVLDPTADEQVLDRLHRARGPREAERQPVGRAGRQPELGDPDAADGVRRLLQLPGRLGGEAVEPDRTDAVDADVHERLRRRSCVAGDELDRIDPPGELGDGLQGRVPGELLEDRRCRGRRDVDPGRSAARPRNRRSRSGRCASARRRSRSKPSSVRGRRSRGAASGDARHLR